MFNAQKTTQPPKTQKKPVAVNGNGAGLVSRCTRPAESLT